MKAADAAGCFLCVTRNFADRVYPRLCNRTAKAAWLIALFLGFLYGKRRYIVSLGINALFCMEFSAGWGDINNLGNRTCGVDFGLVRTINEKSAGKEQHSHQ